MEEKKISWRKCLLLAWTEGTVSVAKYISDITATPYDAVAHIIQEQGLDKALEEVFKVTPNKIDDALLPVASKIVVQLLEEKE